jgi:prolyl oligopeptidase
MQSSSQAFVYPPTRKSDQVDNYHGTQVADPYRWLEDLNSEETNAWVEAQNQLTFSYLSEISAREPLKKRLLELWNYEKYGIPFKQGNRYFYFKNDGLQNQSVLYTLTTLDAEPTVLFDPNLLSEDGTIALSGLAISEDGQWMAYGLSTSGSDWNEWKVRNVETGEDFRII